MKIICTVKFVPDVDKFKFDFETNTVVRENIRMILNPEDAHAIAFALEMKSLNPNIIVEVVTMGPKSVRTLTEDLVRVGVDRVYLISDKAFAGSDTYATSRTLSAFIKGRNYSLILTGSHAIDGDTSHVPAQISDILDLSHMSCVSNIDKEKISEDAVVFTVENELREETYEMNMPCVLSLSKDSKYKMPYISFANMNKDVSDEIVIVNNDELKLHENEIGSKGSLTKVNRTFVKEYIGKDKQIVNCDEEGIEIVYNFLKQKGYME